MISLKILPAWGSGLLFCALSSTSLPALSQTETSPLVAVVIEPVVRAPAAEAEKPTATPVPAPAPTEAAMTTPDPVPAPTSVPTAALPIKFGMEARFRYESTVDKDLKSSTDFLSVRLRPSFTYTINLKASVFLQPQLSKALGVGVYQPATGATNTFVESSGNSSYAGDELRVHQAYLDLEITESLRFIGGRQELVYGDQYLLSASNWFMYGRTFDAAKLRFSEGKSFVDVVHAKIATPSTTNDVNGADKSMSVIYGSWAANEMLTALDLYSVYISDDRLASAPGATATSAQSYYGAHGARIASQFGQTGLKLEYNQNYGAKGSDYLDDTDGAYMSVMDLSYSFEDSGKTKVSLELFSAGKNWRDIYPTTHQTLGTSDVLGRRNLTGAAIHYSTDLSEKWNLQGDLYSFQRTSTDNPAYATNSKTAVGAINVSDSKDLGLELDLRARYKLDKNTSVGAGIGAFQTGAFLKDGAAKDKNPSYSYVIVETKL